MRRYRNNEECPMVEHCAHVATFLTHQSCKMKHKVFLGGSKAYTLSDLAAFKIMSRMAYQYLLSIVSLLSGGSDQTRSGAARKKTFISCFESDDEEIGPKEAINADIESDFDLYMCVAASVRNFIPLEFRKKCASTFPVLFRVTKLVFTPNASSTTPERVFNVAQSIRSKKSRLTAGLTECLLNIGDYIKRHKRLPEEND